MAVTIIAELAQGFEGSVVNAKLLLKAAACAGAKAAKFQLVYADELATPNYKYFNLFKSLEMGDDEWSDIAQYSIENNIELQLDIFGVRSLKLAEKIGVKTVKLHSTDIANIGLLKEVAASSINCVLLGAGGAYLSELRNALSILANKVVVIMLGFQGYPTPTGSNQINRIKLFKEKLCADTNIKIGFADHSDPDSKLSLVLPALALGAGAEFIEKHLTLGMVLKMEDFESALNPDDFKEFSDLIVLCDQALGEAVFEECLSMSDDELGYRRMIRRNVVAARDLVAGTLLEPTDLVLKRTSTPESIDELGKAYNRRLKNNLSKNAAITTSDLLE